MTMARHDSMLHVDSGDGPLCIPARYGNLFVNPTPHISKSHSAAVVVFSINVWFEDGLRKRTSLRTLPWDISLATASEKDMRD